MTRNMHRVPELPGYTFVEILGQGGTARVARVKSQATLSDAALKYAPADQTATGVDFAKLAARERHLIGGLRFPGLVRLIRPQPADPSILLLELCSGPTLERCGPIFDVPLLLNTLTAVAADLEFLRLSGIVHGDLKPDNIFLPADLTALASGQLSFVKISDFSLGRLDSEPDDARAGLGTVGYMAPETVVDKRADHRSDLFALGLIAWQMASGRNPFINGDADPAEINSHTRELMLQPLSTVAHHVPDGLSDIVGRLLEKDPAARPASGWEVCTMLERIGASYPYRRLLHPNHCLRPDDRYDTACERFFTVAPQHRDWLDTITDRSTDSLRVVVIGNWFGRRSLAHDGRKFSFCTRAAVPARLRRRALTLFRGVEYSEKKKIITDSLVESHIDGYPRILPALLPHLLRTTTVKRVALDQAEAAVAGDDYTNAARCYLMAGDLEQAELAAHQAGKLLEKEGLHSRAVNLLDAVIDFGESTGRYTVIRALLMQKADLLKSLGEVEAALLVYQHLIEISRDLPVDKTLAETYKDMGDIFKARRQPADGRQALEKSLELYTQLGDELEISHVHNNLGNLYTFEPNFRRALHHYRLAMRIQRRLAAGEDLSSTVGNIGTAYAIQGRLGWAIRCFNTSLALRREQGNSEQIARTLNNLGYVHHELGNTEQSIDCLKESLELNRRISNQKEILFNLENLSVVMVAAGKLKQSMAYLTEGSALANKLGDRHHNAIFARTLAQVLIRLGRYDDAAEQLSTCERIMVDIDEKTLEALVMLSRANLLLHLGDNPQALTLAKEALSLAEASEDRAVQTETLITLYEVSDCEEFARLGLAQAEQLRLSHDRLAFQVIMLEVSLRNGHFERSRELWDEMKRDVESKSSDIDLPRYCNAAARLHLLVGDTAKAGVALKRALNAAQSNRQRPEMIETLALMADLSQKNGDYESAFKTLTEAVRIAKEIADGISDPDQRRIYQSKPIFTSLADSVRNLKLKTAAKNGRS